MEGSSFQGWAAAFHLYSVFALLLWGASQGGLAPGCQTIARLCLPDKWLGSLCHGTSDI